MEYFQQVCNDCRLIWLYFNHFITHILFLSLSFAWAILYSWSSFSHTHTHINGEQCDTPTVIPTTPPTHKHKEINVFAFSHWCVLSFPLSNKFHSNLVTSINMRFPSAALIYCSYQIHIARQVRHATFHFHAVALQIRHATLTRKMTAEAEPKGSGLCLRVTFRFHSTNITRRRSIA